MANQVKPFGRDDIAWDAIGIGSGVDFDLDFGIGIGFDIASRVDSGCVRKTEGKHAKSWQKHVKDDPNSPVIIFKNQISNVRN